MSPLVYLRIQKIRPTAYRKVNLSGKLGQRFHRRRAFAKFSIASTAGSTSCTAQQRPSDEIMFGYPPRNEQAFPGLVSAAAIGLAMSGCADIMGIVDRLCRKPT